MDRAKRCLQNSPFECLVWIPVDAERRVGKSQGKRRSSAKSSERPFAERGMLPSRAIREMDDNASHCTRRNPMEKPWKNRTSRFRDGTAKSFPESRRPPTDVERWRFRDEANEKPIQLTKKTTSSVEQETRMVRSRSITSLRGDKDRSNRSVSLASMVDVRSTIIPFFFFRSVGYVDVEDEPMERENEKERR